MQHILDVQIPDQNPQGAPGGDFQRIDSSPDMFGAIGARAQKEYGQGLENLGAGISKAGTTGLEIATEQQQLENRVHATDVKSWYADQTTDLHTQFTALSGRAALDALPEYKAKLADLKSQALEKVPGAQTKAMLSESLTTMQDQYYRYWSGHAGGQLKTYQDKVAQDAVASSAALAVNSLLAGDETGFERRLREQDAEVHNLYDSQGYEPDAMQSEVTKRRGATLKVAIETVAAGGDVGKAQALFDRYKERMDPASVLAVTANLKSGVAQLNGRNIADEESGHVAPKADSVAGVPASFVSAVKRTEGYAPAAKWDNKQFSNGYGTRAAADGEPISREEADKRFATEFAKAAKIVDGVNPNLDPGTRAALTSLTYNAGADWTKSGLGDKVRAGDIDGAKAAFLQYNKAGGETNEGLLARRYREAQWFGSAEAPAGNGPLVDKQTAYERVLARTDNNPLLQTAAMARLNQVYSIYHTEQATQNAAFDLRLKDSQAEAMAIGTAQKPLTEPDFVNRYGVSDGQKEYAEYQKNLALGADVASLATMSPTEQAGVLAKHAPQPGSEGYATELKRQAIVRKAITDKAGATVEPRIRDTQSEALSTGTVKDPVSEAEFVNLFGDTEGRRKFSDYRKNLALGADVAALPKMSAAEQTALLARYAPSAGSDDFEADSKREAFVRKAITHLAEGKVEPQIKETEAEAFLTGAVKTPVTEAEFINLYGEAEGGKRFDEYRKNLATGAEIAGLPTMSPDEQARVLASHTPEAGAGDFAEEQKRQAALQKAVSHIAQERDKDPAAFALRRLPAAQAAFGDFNTVMTDPKASPQARQGAAAQFAAVMLAEQARVGVAPEDRRVVPQGYIDRLNATLAAPDKEGGTGMVAQKIQAEAALWGANWPQVYRQLSKDAVPTVRVIGSGVQPAAAQALVDLMPLSLSAILKDQDTEKNAAIKKDVLEAFKPLAGSMAGNEGATSVFNDFRGEAEKLAAKYVIGGMTSSEAAAKAFDQLVGFKYSFQDGYRVPKDAGVEPAAVARGSVAALRDLGKPVADNLAAAKSALNLTPEEENLYKRHLTNLTGTGGVDNPDGSRSSLKNITVESDGRTYVLPTVYDGKIVSQDEAWQRAKDHLAEFPSYASEAEASARYDKMHAFMDKDTAAFGAVRHLQVMPGADTMGGLTLEYRTAATIRSLQRDGKWVTSPDETGLMLVHNDQAVRRADGKPLVMTWKQLGDAAAKSDRAFTEGLREAGTGGGL